MKQSCAAWLATYLVLAAATGAIVYRRLQDPVAVAGGAAVGGGIASMGVAYFAGIAKKFGKARMIRRGLSGEPPRDGATIAAVGRISPSGLSSGLTSPLSKSSCVAYKYEIRSGSGNEDTTFYEGFALAPSVIQGRQHSIRLFAWGDLNVSWQLVPVDVAQPNAEAYIRETAFREPAILNFRKSLAAIREIYKDDDGSVRWDERGLRPPLDTGKPINLQSATFRELLVRPGDTVCVVGRYSAARGGIVPSDHPFTDPVTVEVGESDEDAFARSAASGAAGYFIGGVIFTGIYIAALIALFTFQLP